MAGVCRFLMGYISAVFSYSINIHLLLIFVFYSIIRSVKVQAQVKGDRCLMQFPKTIKLIT